MTVWNVNLDLVVVWCYENKLKGVLCSDFGFWKLVRFLRLIVQGRCVLIFCMQRNQNKYGIFIYLRKLIKYTQTSGKLISIVDRVIVLFHLKVAKACVCM